MHTNIHLVAKVFFNPTKFRDFPILSTYEKKQLPWQRQLTWSLNAPKSQDLQNTLFLT